MIVQPKTLHVMFCCVISPENQILLLKRSPDKKLYPNKWAVVGAAPLTGDEDMEAIALREIKDELGVEGKILKQGSKIVEQFDGDNWIVYPFLGLIQTQYIKLNSEHTDYRWIDINTINEFDTVPRTSEIIHQLID